LGLVKEFSSKGLLDLAHPNYIYIERMSKWMTRKELMKVGQAMCLQRIQRMPAATVFTNLLSKLVSLRQLDFYWELP